MGRGHDLFTKGNTAVALADIAFAFTFQANLLFSLNLEILKILLVQLHQSSSSRMRVINHNWSATKQRSHPQSVAEISRHSVLSGDRIRQCETSSGSRHKDTDQCL